MYLKHENVFQIHKIHANCISITKYKLLLLSKQNSKYKIHEMYFNYVFQLLVFQLLYNTANPIEWSEIECNWGNIWIGKK